MALLTVFLNFFLTNTATRTDADYCGKLREVYALTDPDRDSPEGERLEVIGTLVQAYEAEHYPIEAIRFCMDQSGLAVL